MRKEAVNYQRHILQWKDSGKSKAKYCAENAISYHAFNYHLKRQPEEAKRKGFVQVNVASPVQGNVEFHFGNGNRFVFTQGCTAKYIHEVLFGC